MKDFKKKTRVLLICCVLMILAVGGIQYYLIGNTYRLTRNEYFRDVRNEMNSVLSTPEVKKHIDSCLPALKEHLALVLRDSLDWEASLERFRGQRLSYLSIYNSVLDSIMQYRSLLRDVAFQVRFDEIILYADGTVDTLLRRVDAPIVMLGTDAEDNGSFQISQGRQRETGQIVGEGRLLDFEVAVSTGQYLDISGWEGVVLGRMGLVFGLALLIMGAMIVLFYQMMSTAIRQKKIADIKTDFTNNITHELKTPLSSLKIITKRLEKKHGSEDFGRLLQTLERQHNRINGIIDQVLESSMTDRTDPVMKDVDIVMELHNYLDNLFIESHRVVRDIMGHGVMLNTDMQRLETILNNLTENAAKYSEKGKVITVRGYPEGNFYYIQVVDQGEGMEREHVSHAFDKFYRVPKENRHEVKGLGLGLYFCKQAATELGADLSVSSKVGEGSCFTLKLRIRQARYGVLEL